MKVLHFIGKLSGGGLERRMIELVRYAAMNDLFEQQIVTYSDVIEYKDILKTNVKIIVLKTKGHFDCYKQIDGVINAYRPDIVHSWLDRFPTEHVVLPILKLKYKYKYIYGAVADGIQIPFFSKFGLTMNFAFCLSDKIVSNSQNGLTAKKAPLKKSVVIYNGFDFNRLTDGLNISDKRAKIKVNSKYVVLMCGRIEKSKDWELFSQLAKAFSSNEKSVTFLAAGNGPLLEQYRAEHKEITNLIYLGRRDDIEELIQTSDVCVLLSNSLYHAEGVSNFILESMAASKPVIATNAGGTPEIVIDNKTGYLVGTNINDIQHKLGNLLANVNLRDSMGKNAKDRINERFLLSEMTGRYVELYRSLINK